MKNTVLKSVIVGMGIGFPVTLLCMILIGGYQPVMKEFLVWMVASALYGVLSTVIFDSKKELALPLAMALHCVGCLIVTLAAAMILGYAENFVSLVAGVLPVFVIVYAVIYGVCIITMKINEKKINEALKQE